jgi:hypothetical protein
MTPKNMPQRSGINNPVQFSANYKIAEVAKRMGITDLSKMQITTRQIYHALKLQTNANLTTLTFFSAVNTTNFPFTNLSENKLQAGEALAVERAYFSVLQVPVGSLVAVTDIVPLEFFSWSRPMLRGDFDLQIDRQTVTKKINTSSFYAPFNKDSNFGAISFDLSLDPPPRIAYGQSVYHFDNSFVIIPQIEFTATLTIPAITVPVDFDYYLMLNLEGLGCLFNPKGNY